MLPSLHWILLLSLILYDGFNNSIHKIKSKKEIGFSASTVSHLAELPPLSHIVILAFNILKSGHWFARRIGNNATLLPLRPCFLFFSTYSGTRPGPGSWVISHDVTSDLILGLGRWQVFLVIWYCANEVGPQFNDIRIKLLESVAEALGFLKINKMKRRLSSN